MTASELPLQLDHSRIAAFCRERGIRRLSLFGSVLRDDFDPARSDVDVLAEFAPGALRGLGLRYFDYGPELSAILGYPVDFCSQLNPHLRESIEREALTVYEQA
jgi:predicted nucleotidyltransferase